MFSGGIGSWATAKRVAEQHGTESLTLLFADVKGDTKDPHIGEDEDTYRFITEAAANIGAPLVRVADGRDIWQVFKDRKFLGNSRQANCSTSLKQIPCRQWLEENCPDSSKTICYVGIDWTESHRLPKIQQAYLPYLAKAPLCDPPFLDKNSMIDWAKKEGLDPPRLYAAGFAHNNCGGGCVRAGHGQFRMLLKQNPDRFKVWEEKEQEVRDHLGKDVAILRDHKNGGVPLTLKAFRQRQGDAVIEPTLFDEQENDIGGCGCFTEYE